MEDVQEESSGFPASGQKKRHMTRYTRQGIYISHGLLSQSSTTLPNANACVESNSTEYSSQTRLLKVHVYFCSCTVQYSTSNAKQRVLHI